MMKKRISGMLILLVLVCRVGYADTINGLNIPFVDIGFAGNLPNTDTYGAVGYNYRISTYEITHTAFAPSGLGDGNENVWVAAAGSNAPAARVNLYEAAMYCNWLTSGNVSNGVYAITGGVVTGINRIAALGTYGTVYALPTEDEWYKAAYYNGATGSYFTYANSTDSQPVMNVDARYGNALGDGAWAVGTGAVELNGTYDMMGNIIEHTETIEGGEVVYRGGGYFQSETSLQSSWRITDVPDPDPDYFTVGIRPVSLTIPEPGTMSLMSLSTVGLFMTRSIRRRKRLGQTLMPVRREHMCDMFGSESEWNAVVEVENDDTLTVLLSELKDGCLNLWSEVVRVHQSIDKAFWNRMVVVHEKQVTRRAELRKTLRKKAIDGFDAFLALIMK